MTSVIYIQHTHFKIGLKSEANAAAPKTCILHIVQQGATPEAYEKMRLLLT